MKPERVRGVCFAIVIRSFCVCDMVESSPLICENGALVPQKLFGTRAPLRFVVPPKFKAI